MGDQPLQLFVPFPAPLCLGKCISRRANGKLINMMSTAWEQQTALCKHLLSHPFPSSPKHLLQAASAHKPGEMGQPRYLGFIKKKSSLH